MCIIHYYSTYFADKSSVADNSRKVLRDDIDNKGILIYVTGPAKIDHVSAKKSPIFSVFAVS